MIWTVFKDAVVQGNPALESDGYAFQAEKSYILPRNPQLPEYEIVAITATNGRYEIEELPGGRYRVEVVEDGEIRATQMIEVTADALLDIALVSPLLEAAVLDNFVRVAGTQFMLNDRPFKRFVGVNITGILHYGETYTDETGHTKQVVAFSEKGHRLQALRRRMISGARCAYSCPTIAAKRGG
jgi:hypothetical protein